MTNKLRSITKVVVAQAPQSPRIKKITRKRADIRDFIFLGEDF